MGALLENVSDDANAELNVTKFVGHLPLFEETRDTFTLLSSDISCLHNTVPIF